MNWTRLAVVGLVVLLLVSIAARRGPDPTGEEPRVTVVVNHDTGETEDVTLERYVMGVVSGEMGRLPSAEGGEGEDWPEEAYAAQAILARTFIMAWLEENPDKPIPSDVTEAQAYRPENITPIIERAVERTRGEVIHYQGELVHTWFHSYAGGMTATAKDGLNYQGEEPGYVKSTELPDNEYAPEDVTSWQASIPLSEVQAGLAEAGINVGTIREVRADGMGPSDRITEVTIVGSSGSHTLHGADFRLHVGPELLKSTKIEQDSLRVEGERLVARGTGFGHGVGLSQWDAYKMARDGKSPEQIVETFFQDIEIVKAWE